MWHTVDWLIKQQTYNILGKGSEKKEYKRKQRKFGEVSPFTYGERRERKKELHERRKGLIT